MDFNTGIERCYTHAVPLLRNWFESKYLLKIDQNYHPRGETSREIYMKQSKLEPLHPRYLHGCHKSQVFTHRLPLYLCKLPWVKSRSQNLIPLLINSHGNHRKKKILCFCHSGKYSK